MERAVPVLLMVIDGWNRFTDHEAFALTTFGKPTGDVVTVAVFSSGSGSPALTVYDGVNVAVPPGARSTGPRLPSSESLTVPTRFGESELEVLVTIIV